MRTGKPWAEEESNLQLGQSSGGSRRKHKMPALSHETATLLGTGCVQRKISLGCTGELRSLWHPRMEPDLEGGNTFSSPPDAPSLHVSPGTVDTRLFLPLLIRSPTVLYNARIIILLPMHTDV